MNGDQFGVPGCDSRAEPPCTVGAAARRRPRLQERLAVSRLLKSSFFTTVLSEEPLATGDPVEVTTASGLAWAATVTEVLEPTPRGFVARTSGRPRGSG